MPRHSKPADLALKSSTTGSENGMQPGPNSSPMNLQGVDLTSFGGAFEHDVAAGLTTLPPLPNSPPGSPRLLQSRDPSKTFLSNFKSRISPDQEQQRQRKASRQGIEEDEQRPGTSSMSKIYHLRKNAGSTPELSLVGSNENIQKQTPTDGSHPPPLPTRPQPSAQHSEDSSTSSRRKEKFKLGINRTKSIRRDSDSKSRLRVNGNDPYEHSHPPKTAPLHSDWPGSESKVQSRGKEKDKRGKSADRGQLAGGSEENLAYQQRQGKEHRDLGEMAKTHGKKMGAILGRFKIGRSHSSHEKDVPDSEYQFKIIRLPLVEQTRLTRISKQLSGCRDKTEYWMPSLPWRCIDYLNTHCEQEGLYRIPGSGPHVRTWQRRFDTDRDVDLLSEEVLDTNEIASMLKAWLRELPTEIMPASLQKSLAAEMQKENPIYMKPDQPATQRLRDTLSELPPFNYYLLFAITCHLSLLVTNSARNKMDLNNLAVCVMPCLNIERWLFNYLVGDWRHCWQGCYTEKEYLEVEKLVEQGMDPEAALQSHLAQHEQTSVANALRAPSPDETASMSEAVSIQSSLPEDRGLSSGSGSIPNTGYDDGYPPRSASRDPSEHRKAENIKPMAYVPRTKAVPDNSLGLGIDQDPRRPHTADQRYIVDDSPQLPESTTKSRSNSNTPRIGHNRSRSDLPATPVKANFGIDYGMPVQRPA